MANANSKKKIEILKNKIILILALTIGAALSLVLLMHTMRSIIDDGEEVVSTLTTDVTYPAEVIFTNAQLMEILEISEVSSAKYIYNSIATAYLEDDDKEKEPKIRYHVYYEGIVKAGIDFDKIDIEIDETKKLISITLPKVAIQDVLVDAESLDFIFMDNKYETEKIVQEAYALSLSDLEGKIQNEEQFLEMAKSNAVSAVEALIKPWVEQLDEEYIVLVS